MEGLEANNSFFIKKKIAVKISTLDLQSFSSNNAMHHPIMIKKKKKTLIFDTRKLYEIQWSEQKKVQTNKFNQFSAYESNSELSTFFN